MTHNKSFHEVTKLAKLKKLETYEVISILLLNFIVIFSVTFFAKIAAAQDGRNNEETSTSQTETTSPSAEPQKKSGSTDSNSTNSNTNVQASTDAVPSILTTTIPFDSVVDKVLGTASRRVVVDWRRYEVLVAGEVGYPLELNNFESRRISVKSFFPGTDSILGLGLNRVITKPTRSSGEVSLTPYRQLGRPSRYEAEVSFFVPLFEGVSTQYFNFMPDIQLVSGPLFSFRMLYYPGMWAKLRYPKVIRSIISPRLSQAEQDNLIKKRLPGMLIDSSKWNGLVGMKNLVFFKSHVFLNFEASLSIPYLIFASDLGFWWDVNLGVGYAF